MLVIAAAQTLAHVGNAQTDPVLIAILDRYIDLLTDEELAILFIVQPGDRAGHLEHLRCRSFEEWEFIDHLDGWFEAVFVISDDGFGHVVLIPDQPDTNDALLNICRANITA